MKLRLALIVPVFNEENNLDRLAAALALVCGESAPIFEVVWVNNASTDRSPEILQRLCQEHAWARTITLDVNQGYGGGVQAGLAAVSDGCTHAAWIPADGQVSVRDLLRIWQQTQLEPACMHKGLRMHRQDSFGAQLVSALYSWMVRWLLGVSVRDCNGLPKILPLDAWKRLVLNEKKFAFDAEIVASVVDAGVAIREHGVSFLKRRHGTSSWSSQRLRTYFQTMQSLLRIARTRTVIAARNSANQEQASQL